MDEKDNKEVAKDDAAASTDEGEQKITVNVGSSDNKEEANTEEVVSEEKKDESETVEDVAAETESETKQDEEEKAPEEGAMPVMDEVKDEPEETITETVTTTESPKEPEPVKPDTGPELKPSVQPVQAAAVSPPTEVAQLKKRNKTLKVWLVIFVLILVALLSAGVVYFNQQNKNSDSTSALEAENAKLQQQLVEQQQNATQQTIDQLNKQLADEQAKTAELTSTIEQQEATIDEYKTAVTALLEACGTACESIDVPEDSSTPPTQ